jgi:hypothetical protein
MMRNRRLLLGVRIGLFGALAVLTARYVAVVLMRWRRRNDQAASEIHWNGTHEEGPERVAYVLDVSALRRPSKGMEWRKIDSFSAAEEVLNDPGLRPVFKTAIDKGCAIV